MMETKERRGSRGKAKEPSPRQSVGSVPTLNSGEPWSQARARLPACQGPLSSTRLSPLSFAGWVGETLLPLPSMCTCLRGHRARVNSLCSSRSCYTELTPKLPLTQRHLVCPGPEKDDVSPLEIPGREGCATGSQGLARLEGGRGRFTVGTTRTSQTSAESGPLMHRGCRGTEPGEVGAATGPRP